MNKELIGIIVGVIVSFSLIPYAWRVYHGKVQPVLSSWFLWTIIAVALLVTYWGAGAKESVWMAVVGFINPLLITILVAVKFPEKIRLSKLEQICLFLGICSIALWFVLRSHKSLVQYALYVALLADVCAGIPTMDCYWRNPLVDRPFAWILFSIASVINIFAVSECTVSNYAYPVYMAVGSMTITLPLIIYRIRKRIPLVEWI
ncbi:MAG: hypothetical protein WC827_02590 [Candidatus Paceibacterota bacterium]